LGNQPEPSDEQLTPFQLIEKAVDLALQAHGIHGLEVRATVGEIVQVAKELGKTDSRDFRKGVYDHKKIASIDRESLIRAIAIYKAVAADLLGMSYEQIERQIDKYAKEFLRR